MKIRYGFVSNSSSTAFICSICGEVDGGWDYSLYDFDGAQCVHGHVFHINCAPNKDEIREMIRIDESENDYSEDIRYGLPIEFCPCCQLKVITDADLLFFLLDGKDRKLVEEQMRTIYNHINREDKS